MKNPFYQEYSVSFKRSLLLQLEYLSAGITKRRPSQTSRRFQAYCIGTPRSGTHSFGYMFKKHYRSAHEPAEQSTLIHLLEYLKGRYTSQKMDSLLLARDKRLQLEMEASHPLHHVVENLTRLFPDAKFILTIRDPYSWLSSEINQGVRNFVLEDRVYKLWATIRDYRYNRYQFEFQKPEQSFADIDSAYPIASLLSYWRDHNQSVIDTVPSKQLFIIKTTEIKTKIPEIAKFLGIDPETIDTSKSRSGAASENPFDLRGAFSDDFLKEQMQLYCGDLVKTFFPELMA